MTLRIVLNMATLALLCVFSLGHVAFAATPSYRIDMTVLKDGSLVGKPAVVAEAGARPNCATRIRSNRTTVSVS